MGGKAASLRRLLQAGFSVPPFIVVEPGDALDRETLGIRMRNLDPAPGATFAVRSSADVEDGTTHSYAGIFSSYLFVEPADIIARIEDVRSSGLTERSATYRILAGAPAAGVPSAIVQSMIDADVAGVAFGRDPVDGSDRVVVSASFGLGSGIVGGDCDTDTYRIDGNGRIEQTIAHKRIAHRRSEAQEGTGAVAVLPALARLPALDAAQTLAIAETVRAVGAHFGAPQDVEWAIADGRLWILQARPVTTAPGILWDNSNIAESYGGVVLPLTSSFVRVAYAGAYRQFLQILAVRPSAIAANADAIDNLLGCIDGRLYYRLLNWYRLLALVPGFRLNRGFMETMMGVSEGLPAATIREIASTSTASDIVAVLTSAAALTREYLLLPRHITRFHRLIDRALRCTPPLEGLGLSQLDAEYVRLKAALLTNWQAPLVNDFFAMIAYGLLAKLDAQDGEAIVHDLLRGEGGMISTEPARRVASIAALAQGDDALLEAFARGSREDVRAQLERRPDAAAAIRSYIERFGDRCQGELKLESVTLHDDPVVLYRGIARIASASARERNVEKSPRERAERRLGALTQNRPIRSRIVRFVLHQARTRLRDRENLRFERTRVFGYVRRIFVQIGKRFAESGHLDDARDIFYLEIDEVREAIAHPGRRSALRPLISERRARYRAYEREPDPPTRFTSIDERPPAVATEARDWNDETQRIGIGACPGIVRARVRLVASPESPFEAGDILVAKRTDPGWIVLFAAASGILVEHGSVLSHAAIVSRELGIPSVVGIPGLTQWLRDGDVVEFDGRSGSVRRIDGSCVIP